MNAVLALTLNGFRESRRNRVTLVVFAFAFILIIAAMLSLELTVATFDRVITDVGLGVMSILTAGLTIFLGSGLIPREIERRTIFMIIAKPVSRSAFVVGRFFGNVFTVWVITIAMGLLFTVELALTKSTIDQSHFVALWGLLLEILLLSAVCFVFACASSQFVSALSTVGLYFIGHMLSDLLRYAEKSPSAMVKGVGTFLFYILPNLERLDFKGRATYFQATSLSEVASATVYACGYSMIALAIAAAIFSKRDFR